MQKPFRKTWTKGISTQQLTGTTKGHLSLCGFFEVTPQRIAMRRALQPPAAIALSLGRPAFLGRAPANLYVNRGAFESKALAELIR